MKELFDFITSDCNGYDIYDEEIEEAIKNPQQKYHVQRIVCDIYQEFEKIDAIDNIQDKESALDELRTDKFMTLISPICFFKNRSKEGTKIKKLFTQAKCKYTKKLLQELLPPLFLSTIKENKHVIGAIFQDREWEALDCELKRRLLELASKDIYTKFYNFIDKYPNNRKVHQIMKDISAILKDKEEELLDSIVPLQRDIL